MILPQTQTKFALKIFYDMQINLGRVFILLEEARKSKGMTQKELAKKALDVGDQQYRNLLNRHSNMTLVQLIKICDVLEISIANLFAESSIENLPKEKVKDFLIKGINEFQHILKQIDSDD